MKKNFKMMMEKLLVLLVTLVLISSSLLIGCGTSTATTTHETKAEVVDRGEETTDEEVVQTENLVELETYETALDWAISVNATIPELTIWNSLTKQGIILENEQKYLVKEGDILVLCGNFEGSIDTQIDAPMLNRVLSTSIHQEYEFMDIPVGETDINILLRVNEEEYELGLIIVSENAAVISSEGSEITDMSGKEWAATLEYDEPKLLAWNDETGTKEVIDNGGTYRMQEGDVLGVYNGATLMPAYVNPYEFCPGITVGGLFSTFEYVLPETSQTINLEVEFTNMETYEFEEDTFKCTIITP